MTFKNIVENKNIQEIVEGKVGYGLEKGGTEEGNSCLGCQGEDGQNSFTCYPSHSCTTRVHANGQSNRPGSHFGL